MFNFQIISLFLLVSSALSLIPPYYDLEDADQLYAEFIKKYDRHFESREDFSKRFEAFKRNLQELNEFNEMFKYHDGGHFINRFTDEYERKPCYRASFQPNVTQNVMKEFIVNAPASIDYRNLCSPVKNQGDCGDCYIFAAIETIESAYAKQTGTVYSLSEQQPLDCFGTCGGGDPSEIINDMVQPGCMTEQDYPYVGKAQTCHTDPSKVKVKVSGGNILSTPDVESLKGALAQNGAPVGIGLYGSDQMKRYSGSEILTLTDCVGHDADHAVLLVGYNTDPSGKNYWIIKNSWGTDHGDNGYYYIDMQSTADCKIGLSGAYTASVA